MGVLGWLVSFLGFVATALAVPQSLPGWKIGQKVITTSGTYQGHANADVPSVSEYLGIRFGQNTTGANRFMAPKPFVSPLSVSNANNFGPGCPPEGNAPAVFQALLGSPPPSSEDCLFLNVWTKPQSGGIGLKPVMLWFYGGGFIVGDSNNELYVGANLVNNQDVVVVTANYRTNIFSFPGGPGLPDQNVAILDQRLAVEWVVANIALFGGDPTKITMFGESAGGAIVDYYAYAYPTLPLVSALISESGSSMASGPFALPPATVRNSAWYSVSQAVGCGAPPTPDAAIIKCMQGVSVSAIEAVLVSANGSNPYAFGPTIDNKLIFSDYYALAKAGSFAKIPYLSGSNHNESLPFILIGGPGPSAIGTPADIAINNAFRCGDRDAAKARVDNGVPVWRYHLALTPPGNDTGAIHTSEISYVFNTTPYPVQAQLGVQYVAGLNSVIQGAWGAFAHDPVNGLTTYGWPRYTASGTTLVRLGYNLATTPDFVAYNLYDGDCPASTL